MKKLTILFTIFVITNHAYTQSVEIKDGDATPNTLIQINDEGSAGSITIPDASTVGTTTSKLYNEGGALKWDGTTLATGSSLWTLNSGNVYRNSGNVGIGTTTPTSELHVVGEATNFNQVAYIENTLTSNVGYGIYAESKKTDGEGIGGVFWGGDTGAEGRVWPMGSNHYYGLVGRVSKGEMTNPGTNHGVYGQADGGNVNYGVFGTTSGPGINWGGYFIGKGHFSDDVGIGTITPSSKLHVVGEATNFNQVAYIENTLTSNVGYGIYAESKKTDGEGIGGVFWGGDTGAEGRVWPMGSNHYYGLVGRVSKGEMTNPGTNHGVYGQADGGNVNYGVFGTTSGPGTNWGGYFIGKGHFSDDVGIGINNPAYRLDVDGGNILVRGDDGYTAAGHTGIVYLGSVHSYIKAEHGYGVKIGVYSAADAIAIKEISGNVGIGTTTPAGKLDVNGSIYQRGSSLYADFVFEDDYELESIQEHSDFMWTNKHLLAIPKAQVDENGLEIVEMGSHRKGIVEELEKAHIYIAQLEERIKHIEESLVIKE